MAPPFMLDYLARLIIAPQPERANLAPRSSCPRAGLFLRGTGRSTPLGRPSGARCARESLSLAITREAEPRQPEQHHRPGGRLGDDAGAHDDFATVGKSTLPVHGRLTSAEDGPYNANQRLTHLERDALAVAQNELLARASDLEQMVTAGEAASSSALALLAERSAKLEQTERDLDENQHALHALSEQLPAIRAEFVSKETRLREVEQQRAALNDRCGLLTQENDALRTRIEELVVNASKLSRQLSELRDERDEIKGLVSELETSLDHETAAHANLKAAHFDGIEAQRLSEANLQEKLSATTTRLEAAELLLAEARDGMHEQDATIQKSAQRVLEKSLGRAATARAGGINDDVSSARRRDQCRFRQVPPPARSGTRRLLHLRDLVYRHPEAASASAISFVRPIEERASASAAARQRCLAEAHTRETSRR